jgi:hypothetical protein
MVRHSGADRGLYFVELVVAADTTQSQRVHVTHINLSSIKFWWLDGPDSGRMSLVQESVASLTQRNAVRFGFDPCEAA